MAQEDADLGELIRNLINQEQEIIHNFEEKEDAIEKSKRAIDAKVSKILKEAREKAEEEAKKILTDQEKISESEAGKLLRRQEEEIKKIEKAVENERKRIVDLSLKKIIGEVLDAVSRETL